MLRDEAVVAEGMFCTNNEETIGASPDNFVRLPIYTIDEAGDRQHTGDSYGLLEIKCGMAKNQVKALIKPEVEREHWPQLQGQLLVTGRDWVDIMYYHPKLPPVIIRVERDDEYIAKLVVALDLLLKEKNQLVEQISAIINPAQQEQEGPAPTCDADLQEEAA